MNESNRGDASVASSTTANVDARGKDSGNSSKKSKKKKSKSRKRHSSSSSSSDSSDSSDSSSNDSSSSSESTSSSGIRFFNRLFVYFFCFVAVAVSFINNEAFRMIMTHFQYFRYDFVCFNVTLRGSKHANYPFCLNTLHTDTDVIL